MDADPGRHPRRSPAHRPRRLPGLRPVPPVPDIYETIRDAEPLDDPVAFRFPASVRHRYERLDRFPDGLLVMGDAVCSFDPVYGQGMTVAALEALTLQRHLQPGTPRPGPFFADLAGVVDVPWDIAVGGDLVYPGVEGRRTLRSRLINTYLGRLHAAAGDRDAVPAAPTWADHAS